jgi:two-component system alkaline phosphatase synthesis response regulator PhoP
MLAGNGKYDPFCDVRSMITYSFEEFELLKYLMENAGIVLTRDKLLEEVWGYEYEGETRTLDVHIRTLRQKLGEAGAIIETVRGVGYKIGGKA